MLKMLLPVVEKWGTDEDSYDNLPILFYQVGELAKCFTYRKRYPQDADGYTAAAKVAMMDTLAQCLVICEREDWDFREILELGIEHCKEKIERHLRNGE